MHKATTPESVVAFVQENDQVQVRGGGSKNALSQGANLDLSGLAGVLEYEPSEYTFTALAGTSVREVQRLLEAHGQFLPFDPLFVEAGATLGGTLASGLAGPGRVRFGGVRDFVLGVQFVDGLGRLARGGGKVVKNAAGFDLPKLMVGALGGFGVLTELTFKVFPKPPVQRTLDFSFEAFTAALEAIAQLNRSPLEPHALELLPSGPLLSDSRARVRVRLGGFADGFAERTQKLEAMLNRPAQVVPESVWQSANAFSWLGAEAPLVKVPVTLNSVAQLEQRLPEGSLRQYSAGGSVAWISVDDVTALHRLLLGLDLSGLVLRGAAKALIGKPHNQVFAARIKQALDPHGKFSHFGVD